MIQNISESIKQVGKTIQDAAYEVRLNLAPGFLESVYRLSLIHI